MKFIFLFVGLFVSIGVGAEIWEKPKYTPDEGHLQEEIERQEERPNKEKEKNIRMSESLRPTRNSK